MHPDLAHLYDDLAVECIANDEMLSIDYLERAAQRLLSENRGGFGSRVWAIQHCLTSRKQDLRELAERSYLRLLSELREAYDSTHKYRNQQLDFFGPHAPGLKSPAIHFASSARMIPRKWKFEPLLHEAIGTLIPRAHRAWEIYRDANPVINTKITMAQVWESSVISKIDLNKSRFKLDLENKSLHEFFEDSKALLFISLIMNSYGNQNQNDRAPMEFGKWCELMRRYGKEGSISTAELDEESTDYLKNVLERKLTTCQRC